MSQPAAGVFAASDLGFGVIESNHKKDVGFAKVRWERIALDVGMQLAVLDFHVAESHFYFGLCFRFCKRIASVAITVADKLDITIDHHLRRLDTLQVEAVAV